MKVVAAATKEEADSQSGAHKEERVKGSISGAIVALLMTGCATTFQGDAHIAPRQCEATCQGWGMELVGMVAVGEYSEGCICEVPGKKVAASSAAPAIVEAAGAAVRTASSAVAPP